MPVSGDISGSENSESLSFLVPRLQPKETTTDRRPTRFIPTFTAAVIFIVACAAFGVGFTGTVIFEDSGFDKIARPEARLQRETYGQRDEAAATDRELAAAREQIVFHIAREGALTADSMQAERLADDARKELKQVVEKSEARAEALARDLTSVRESLAAARDEIALHIRRENAVQAYAVEAKRVADSEQTELNFAIERQKGDLSELIWSVPEIIWQLSQQVALGAGGIIMTGTPAGVAAVSSGDQIECGVDGVGTLKVMIGEPE